jgi:hypothetical protein
VLQQEGISKISIGKNGIFAENFSFISEKILKLKKVTSGHFSKKEMSIGV